VSAAEQRGAGRCKVPLLRSRQALSRHDKLKSRGDSRQWSFSTDTPWVKLFALACADEKQDRWMDVDGSHDILPL
jgi:hypothetical protein